MGNSKSATNAIRILLIAAALSILFLLPEFLDRYLLHITILVLLMVVVAASWNLTATTGLISFGHAGFFGIGAYSAALLMEYADKGPLWGLPLAATLSMIAAFLVGLVCLRLRGIYFAMATLAFTEALRVLVAMTPGFTLGGSGVGLPPLFGANRIYSYYLILCLAIVTFATSHVIRRSTWYFAFTSIRENEQAATMLGVNITAYKILSFVVGALFVGLAGGFYAYYISYIDPHSAFSAKISLEAQIMSIIGGLYTHWGPVLGAVILTILSEFLRSTFGEIDMLVYGLALVFSILYMPMGFFGFIQHMGRRRSA